MLLCVAQYLLSIIPERSDEKLVFDVDFHSWLSRGDHNQAGKPFFLAALCFPSFHADNSANVLRVALQIRLVFLLKFLVATLVPIKKITVTSKADSGVQTVLEQAISPASAPAHYRDPKVLGMSQGELIQRFALIEMSAALQAKGGASQGGDVPVIKNYTHNEKYSTNLQLLTNSILAAILDFSDRGLYQLLVIAVLHQNLLTHSESALYFIVRHCGSPQPAFERHLTKTSSINHNFSVPA